MKLFNLILAVVLAVMLGATHSFAESVMVTENGKQVEYIRQPDGSLRPAKPTTQGLIATPESTSQIEFWKDHTWYGWRFYDSLTREWCIQEGTKQSRAFSCTPEFHLPISTLRMFRQQMGMEIEALRYNYITGKMEPLPND